jgi:glycosyltransferase involved in cell wall biosynthesis
MTDRTEISIVLPVYNQADHIEEVVNGYLGAFASFKHASEFILVVNGNRDGSLDCCRRLDRIHPTVRCVHNDRPGWGRAVRTGLEAACGDILCYTNSARTSPHILALHVMVALANSGWVIKANRRLRHPFVRRAGSVLYNAQCRYLFDLAVWDVNGTPKVFDREAFERLQLKEDGDLVDVELLVRSQMLGLPILEVPIVAPERHGSESTTNYASAFTMYTGAFRLWRKLRQGA